MKFITKSTLGSKIKNLRTEVDMEQEVVARVLQIPRSAVCAIEQGRRDVSAIELIELCKLFRISPNDLLGWPRYQKRKSCEAVLEDKK